MIKSLFRKLWGPRRYSPQEVGAMAAEQRADAYLANDSVIDELAKRLRTQGSPLSTEKIRRELICFASFADWFAFMFHPSLEGNDALLEPLLETYTNRIAKRMYSAGLWSIRASLGPEGMGPLEGEFHEQFYKRSEEYHAAAANASSEGGLVNDVVEVCMGQVFPGGSVPGETRDELKETLGWFVTSTHQLLDGLVVATPR